MIRRTPNGFERFMTSLHKAFLLFYALAILYRIIFSQNARVIYLKKLYGGFRIFPSPICILIEKLSNPLFAPLLTVATQISR